ncbi:hypothetical protein [Actinomadura sp. NPDC000600]|uniref:hypothetical protein n=1 Tax=Actinomadura sp. NPDC000600 TaxID=3154262 RepID=UPI003391B5F6
MNPDLRTPTKIRRGTRRASAALAASAILTALLSALAAAPARADTTLNCEKGDIGVNYYEPFFAEGCTHQTSGDRSPYVFTVKTLRVGGVPHYNVKLTCQIAYLINLNRKAWQGSICDH